MGERVVLVGHRLVGVNIDLAAEMFPDKVGADVFLCAFMPVCIAQFAGAAGPPPPPTPLRQCPRGPRLPFRFFNLSGNNLTCVFFNSSGGKSIAVRCVAHPTDTLATVADIDARGGRAQSASSSPRQGSVHDLYLSEN
jgi:hypothetical protein